MSSVCQDAIPQEQRKMPLHEIVNDTMLIELIESEWTPETDPYTSGVR